MNNPRLAIADALDSLCVEVLRAETKTDALVLADSFRVLASKAEQLAEELPEQSL